jgi:hypothetical protein
MLRTRCKVKRHRFFLDKQSVVWAEPRTILGIRAGIVGKTAETGVPTDGGEIPPRRMDDVVDFLQEECQCQR